MREIGQRTMWLDKVAPNLVTARSVLSECLKAEALARGWRETECHALMAIVPDTLLSCACFLDKLTGIWRYEFGRPHRVRQILVWGTHMWAPIQVLFDVLACARLRLPPEKLDTYLILLTDLDKHQEYLVEMLPLLRLPPRSTTPQNGLSTAAFTFRP
jgi:hypothetical protein